MLAETTTPRGRLVDFLTFDSHASCQKRQWHFASTCQCKIPKTFKPPAVWNVWIGFQPMLELDKICFSNPPIPEPLD